MNNKLNGKEKFMKTSYESVANAYKLSKLPSESKSDFRLRKETFLNEANKVIEDSRCHIKRAIDNDRDFCFFSVYGGMKSSEILTIQKIPETYWESQSIFLPQDKQIHFDEKLTIRIESYNKWLNYLVSGDASHIPGYLFNWILDGVNKLGRFNTSTNKFKKRRSTDLCPFAPLYPDCLAECVSLILDVIDGNVHSDDEELNRILRSFDYPSFNSLYEYFYVKKIKEMRDLSAVYKQTEGVWRYYSSDSDPKQLSDLLSAFPSIDWCLKSERVTKEYLKDGGSLRIYFSEIPQEYIDLRKEQLGSSSSEELARLELWSTYGYPRLCIRTFNERIYEIRGCMPEQRLDSDISKTKILEDELHEMGPAGVEGLDTKLRLDRFNEIESKYKTGEKLTEDEIIFIIKDSDRFFGNEQDLRVGSLKKEIIKKGLLYNVNLKEVDFTGAEDLPLGYFIKNTILVGSYLNLEGADLSGADLRFVDFRRTNLKGVDFTGADLRLCNLQGADLRGANFTRTSLPQDYLLLNGNFLVGPCLNLEGADLQGANLERVNLEGADLRGANLEGADLRGTNLKGANLEGANLRGADLQGANLEGVNLQGANLEGVNLQGADLYQADLKGADLKGFKLDEAYLREANLVGADLELACFNEAFLQGADLRGANLCGANLEGVYLIGANLNGADLRWCNLKGADLGSANLEGASLRGANLCGANLKGVNLQGVNLEEAILRGASLRGADLQGVNLEGVNLQGADFRGANFNRTILPKDFFLLNDNFLVGPRLNLQGADLQGANLEGANLQGADLRGTNLKGANLEGADLRGADLGWCNLRGANLQGANLEGVHLERANLQGANLNRTILPQDCFLLNDTILVGPRLNLEGVYLIGANLNGADLRWCNLKGADLGSADLGSADLEGVNLEGADLRGANLEGANLLGANLEGADLRGANLEGADLIGANLEGADLRELI